MLDKLRFKKHIQLKFIQLKKHIQLKNTSHNFKTHFTLS